MSNEGTSLSGMLSGEQADAPIEEQKPEPVAEQPDTRPRDEHGRFAPKTGDEPPIEAEPTPGNPIPDEQFKGYLTEKRKRQEAEERASDLERQLQAFQQPQEPPAPPPSVWEDEQGAFDHFGSQIAQKASLNAKLDMSEMLSSQAHEDFDDMKAKFHEMMAVNPALQQQALASRHPWETAYQIAKNAASAAELGATNVVELETKLREKIMAELQQGSTPVPQPAQLPPTLTTERSVGARTGPDWGGPPSLSDMLR